MLERPPTIPPWDLWSRSWLQVHRIRRRWYRKRARRLSRPVVSIGNLHWGGTGKTPIVAALAQDLQTRGHRVCVLSRGYGRQSRGPLVVSRGQGPQVDVSMSGDEPFLHARDLPGVSVVVAESRYLGGQLALAEGLAPDLFLLDDGFSHLDLARDVDLLVLPVEDPWGAGCLPPRGRLREPLESARDSDAILLSGGGATDQIAHAAAESLRPYGFSGPGFGCPTQPFYPSTAEGRPIEAQEPMLLVTGIARGHRVRETAEALDLLVAEHLELPDHHNYPATTVRRIRQALKRTGARQILTTAKDRIKLEPLAEFDLVELGIRASLPLDLTDWLEGKLR
ncbi:MAG: tetraacyldisaccharide 4'-kinase [Thermoanaerobaculia bacterium]|nr:tetraacyldisaccharide 4'-kinase [Thermoanaerobaculia bacterium]